MPKFTQTRHPGGGLSWGEVATEEEELQLELLRKEIANMDKQDEGNAEVSKEAAEMSKKYLGEWNAGLEKAGGMYNAAITEIGKAQGTVADAYADVSKNMGDMSTDLATEWNSMKEQWGGIQSELVGSARGDISDRNALKRQFMDLTRSDEEGASGRAMADVAAQSEAGRQAEAMRMSGLGIDPTSGRTRSMMTMSRNNEALNKAMAGNKARLDEKDRVTGLTAKGLELIDPTKSVNAASAIQGMSNDLLASRSNLEVNRANTMGNLATTSGNLARSQGDLAGGYASNVVAPKGEMGAAQLGVSQATRPAAGAAAGESSDKMTKFRAAQDYGKTLRKQFYGT